MRKLATYLNKREIQGNVTGQTQEEIGKNRLNKIFWVAVYAKLFNMLKTDTMNDKMINNLQTLL